MSKMKKILLTVAAIAFYIGTIGFFNGDNEEAGLLGIVAGTICLATVLMDVRKNKQASTENPEEQGK